MLRKITAIAVCVSVLFVFGCSSGNDPINKGQDIPVPPKKENDKKK
jgi:hypothetical protein